MCGKPLGRRLKPYPTGYFSRKINFAPLWMPCTVVELIDFPEELLYKVGYLLITLRPLRPRIGDQQCPVRNGAHRRSLGNQIWIMFMCNFRRQVVSKY